MPVRQAGEPATDVRRDQMLDAAAALIAERGFGDTRIADVAERVGASPALVIYYFGTKDKLLTAALRHSEDSFYAAAEELLATTTSAKKRLETLVALTCVPQGEDEVPGSWGLWFDLWAQAFRHPTVAADRIELDQRWRQLIARVVSDGMASGQVQKVDPDDFALTFAALLDGLSIQVALDDPVMTPRRAQAVAMRFAAGELGFPWRSARGSGRGGRSR